MKNWVITVRLSNFESDSNKSIPHMLSFYWTCTQSQMLLFLPQLSSTHPYMKYRISCLIDHRRWFYLCLNNTLIFFFTNQFLAMPLSVSSMNIKLRDLYKYRLLLVFHLGNLRNLITLGSWKRKEKKTCFILFLFQMSKYDYEQNLQGKCSLVSSINMTMIIFIFIF